MPTTKYFTAEDKVAALVAYQRRYYEQHREEKKRYGREHARAKYVPTGKPRGRPRKNVGQVLAPVLEQ